MNKLKKLLYILSWIPVAIFHIATMLMGLIIVPIAIHLSEGKKEQWPDIFWLWGNDEEFIPKWWLIRAKEQNWLIKRFPRFWWFAIRNPVNNFRYIFKDRKAKIEGWAPQNMEAIDIVAWKVDEAHRWAYNGPFAGYCKIWLNNNGTYSEFWIGWKVGSTIPGMGFTMQLRLNRKIGT